HRAGRVQLRGAAVDRPGAGAGQRRLRPAGRRLGGRAAGVGAVQAVAVDPSDPNTVYAGTVNGGVWKTKDGGTAGSGYHVGGAAAGTAGAPPPAPNTAARSRLPPVTSGGAVPAVVGGGEGVVGG